MSQAEKTNNTILSRRAALTGLSVAAAAGAVALPAAIAATEPVDPIFASDCGASGREGGLRR